MKQYKLSDEEYKLLMTIGDKSKHSYDSKFYIETKEDGSKYFRLDSFVLNGLYDNVERASKVIAREFEVDGKELFRRMNDTI